MAGMCGQWKNLMWHLVLLSIITFFETLINAGSTIFIPLSTENDFLSAGVLMSCVAIGNTAFNPFAGSIIGKTSSEFGFILYFFCRMVILILMLVSYFLFELYNESRFNFIVWIILCTAFGMCLPLSGVSRNNYIATNIKDNDKRGKFSSYIQFINRAAFIVAPFINGYVGYIYQYDNDDGGTTSKLETAYSIGAMLLLNIGVASFGFIFTVFVQIPPGCVSKKSRNINYSDDNYNTDNADNTTTIITIESLGEFCNVFKGIGCQRFLITSWFVPETALDTRDTCTSDANNEKKKKNGNYNAYDKIINLFGCLVCKDYWQELLMIGIFIFGLRYARRARKLVLTFQSESLGFNYSEIGLINTLSYTPSFVLFLLSGYMMDHYGRKSTAIPSTLLFVIALILVPFCQTFTQLLVVSIMFGIADGISIGLFMTIGTDLAPKKDKNSKAQFLGWFRMPQTLADVIASVVVGVLADNSIFYACLTTAVISAIALVWVVFCVKETMNVRDEQEKMKKNEWQIKNNNNNNNNNSYNGHGRHLERVSLLRQHSK